MCKLIINPMPDLHAYAFFASVLTVPHARPGARGTWGADAAAHRTQQAGLPGKPPPKNRPALQPGRLQGHARSAVPIFTGSVVGVGDGIGNSDGHR